MLTGLLIPAFKKFQEHRSGQYTQTTVEVPGTPTKYVLRDYNVYEGTLYGTTVDGKEIVLGGNWAITSKTVVAVEAEDSNVRVVK